MSARTDSPTKRVESANEVRLVGRMSKAPVVRELPSGDDLMTFRISVDREASDVASRQKIDSVPCCAWSARARRTVSGWHVGDLVEITGAVRCRFFQSARGLGSRVEVEVSSAKIIRRAPDA